MPDRRSLRAHGVGSIPPQRNPTKSFSQIEDELKHTLGACKIIWLAEGQVADRKLPKVHRFIAFSLAAARGFQKGDTIFRVPAASYVNYFVSNNVVLIAKYGTVGMLDSHKQKDDKVRPQFVRLSPDRHVISLYTLGINRGGGIHCATRETLAATR